MWYIWLIAAGVFFIVEIITVGFLVFWLGISALIAMLVSFITNSIFIQMLTFVVSACILIPLTRPLVNKFINQNDTIKTNAFSLINKKGVVLSTISPDMNGQVKVNGEVWTAQSENNFTIEKGTKIEVVKIDGVKLIVSPITTTVS